MSKNEHNLDQTKVYICNECRDDRKKPCVLVVHLDDEWHGDGPNDCPYGYHVDDSEADWVECE